MKLPASFRVGTGTYKVLEPQEIDKARYGVAYLDCKVVKVATHFRGQPRKETGPSGRNEIFWHEVTHVVLHDMGHNLWRDEAFVTAFSRRLAQVIETAKFKD